MVWGSKVGVKTFPRVASTTIREHLGRHDNRKEWLALKERVVVVRDPWDRLFSVWAGLIQGSQNGLHALGYPDKEKGIDGLLEWIIRTPDHARDWHVRGMASQLQGYVPKDLELYLLQDFMAEPPYGLPPVTKHHHRTSDERRVKFREAFENADRELRDAWTAIYQPDYDLVRRAEAAQQIRKEVLK